MTTHARLYVNTSKKPYIVAGIETGTYLARLFADKSAFLLDMDTDEIEYFEEMDSYKLWKTYRMKVRAQ